VNKQRITLGVVALGVVALAIVALIGVNGSQAHRGQPVAAKGQTTPRDPGPSLSPSVSPTATPKPTASGPPAPPPPPPDPYLHVGSQGPDVQALQQKLTSLTYMTAGVDGNFGGGTRDALIAFQKVNGLKLTGEADPPTTDKLASASAPTAAYSTPSDHLEVDIAKQVVYVVRGGTVANTLTTSTGSGQKFTSQGVTQRAITPNGAFHVYWKIPGWHDAPLGHLYKPSFFNGGIAFHGYYDVPSYPASHGCVRLPMEFADWFYDTAAPPGATVYVYGGPNGPNPDPIPETSMSTTAPPPGAPATSPGPPTPSSGPPPSPQGGCLNSLLGLPCPTPTPTATVPTSPTPTSSATSP
jgi:lipoprotein-anchoring transpeptidase ErfK/SrfK